MCVEVIEHPPRLHRENPFGSAYLVGLCGHRRDWHPQRADDLPRVILIESAFPADSARQAKAKALALIRRIFPAYSWESLSLGKVRQ